MHWSNSLTDRVNVVKEHAQKCMCTLPWAHCSRGNPHPSRLPGIFQNIETRSRGWFSYAIRLGWYYEGVGGNNMKQNLTFLRG